MNGFRPDPETRGRLASLTGGTAKVDATVAKYKEDLQQLRTIDLGKVAKETGTADFFVLLSRGKGSAATVEAVKFASGDEKLKVFTDALRTAEYRPNSPDDPPVKILRRGSLSCPPATSTCSFVLMLPDDERRVD